jgi:hypothetical protein
MVLKGKVLTDMLAIEWVIEVTCYLLPPKLLFVFICSVHERGYD